MLKPDTWALTILLASLTALGPISTDMYLPALPGILRDLDTGHAAVQLTLSMFLVGFAVGQIFYGPLADRLGRKPVLAAGLGIYAVASLACTLAPSVELLIVARFAQAFGAAGPIVLARAVGEASRFAVEGAQLVLERANTVQRDGTETHRYGLLLE